MELTTVHDFVADPVTVHALLTQEDFLAEVCRATGSTRYQVASDGTRTAVERTMPSPSVVRRYVGDTLTISEVSTWGPADADGSRQGSIEATVAGIPVTLSGQLELRPGGVGSRLTYSGTLTVAIPLIGKMLEAQASPALVEALDVQERVANQRLGLA